MTPARIRISIFVKVFAAFMIVVSLIYFFSAYLYSHGRGRLQAEMIEQSKNNLHFFLTNLESEFNRVFSTEAEILFDGDLRILTSATLYPDADIFLSINALNAKVNALLKTSAYIDEACVYLPGRNLKISNLINSEIPEAERARLNDMAFLTGFPFIHYDGDFYINFHSHFYQKGFDEPEKLRFVISAKLDFDKLQRDLDALPGNGRFLTLGYGFQSEVRKGDPSLDPDALSNLTPYTASLVGTGPDVYYTAEKSDRLRTMVLLFAEEEAFFESLRFFDDWFRALTLVIVPVILLFVLWIRRIVTAPLTKLIGAISGGLSGDMRIRVKYPQNDEYGRLYQQFNEMMDKHASLVGEVHAQQMLVKDAQLRQLQYQINPHFLYNSFFILHRMAQADEREALISMLSNLGEYYKVVTTGDKLFHSLFQEFEHSANYLEIQSVRFAGRIRVELDKAPEDFSEISSPRLILQPIFENCYTHGLKNKEYDGVIRMRVTRGADVLISIEDNGDELTDEVILALNRHAASRGERLSGLMNVSQRLVFAYGEGYALQFSRSALGGLRVLVRIPVDESGGINV